MKIRNLILAVGYIRMSSDRQGESPKQQKDVIKKMAARLGYKIIRWYEDHGITGDSIKVRPEFCRMLADAQTGEFEVILCWDQDRFARLDSLKAGTVVEPLREAGVRLVTQAQGEIDWNTSMGRMMYSMSQEAKHAYCVDMGRNVVRGLCHSIEKRTYRRGMAPMGYDVAYFDSKGEQVYRSQAGDRFQSPRDWTGRLAISEDAAAVETVRWMFQTYAECDTSLNAIAIVLRSRGVNLPRGGLWTGAAVRRILTNAKYAGDTEVGRLCGAKYFEIGENGQSTTASKKKPKKHKDAKRVVIERDPMMVLKDTHKPLIDRKLFDSVQRKINNRRWNGIHTHASRYIVSGIIHCGHCGAKYHGKDAKRAAARYYAHKDDRNCPCAGSHIDCDQIENYLLSLVKQQIKDSQKQVVERAIQLADDNPRDDLAILKRQLSEADRKVKRAAENCCDADRENYTAMQEVLSERRQEREAIAGRLDLAQMANSPNVTVAKLKAQTAELLERFNEADPSIVRAAMKSTIERVDLWFDRPSRNFRIKRGLVIFRRAQVEEAEQTTRCLPHRGTSE